MELNSIVVTNGVHSHREYDHIELIESTKKSPLVLGPEINAGHRVAVCLHSAQVLVIDDALKLTPDVAMIRNNKEADNQLVGTIKQESGLQSAPTKLLNSLMRRI